MTEKAISLDTFNQLCAADGEISEPKYFLEYLHNAGVVFHRPPMFGGQIILDQKWALDAIYAVLNREKTYQPIKDANGRFRRRTLAGLLWDAAGYTPDEQRLFISMMQQCGICFGYRRRHGADADETVYIAPDLLPERTEVQSQLDTVWDSSPPHAWAEFSYDFLHRGLIRDLIAWAGDQAGLDGIYWRGGVCASEAHGTTRVLIAQGNDAQTGRDTIRVETKGPNAAALCASVSERLRQQNETHGLSAVRTGSGAEAAIRDDRRTPPPDLRSPGRDRIANASSISFARRPSSTAFASRGTKPRWVWAIRSSTS
jgi:internalin A